MEKGDFWFKTRLITTLFLSVSDAIILSWPLDQAGIHPSWEAKQKLKTQSALIGAISLSTKSGNKITFSDDWDATMLAMYAVSVEHELTLSEHFSQQPAASSHVNTVDWSACKVIKNNIMKWPILSAHVTRVDMERVSFYDR